MPRAESAIMANVSQTTTRDNAPPAYAPKIFLFVLILPIKNINGTATTPLMTAVKTKALMGFMPIKFRQRPRTVEIIITA